MDKRQFREMSPEEQIVYIAREYDCKTVWETLDHMPDCRGRRLLLKRIGERATGTGAFKK